MKNERERLFSYSSTHKLLTDSLVSFLLFSLKITRIFVIFVESLIELYCLCVLEFFILLLREFCSVFSELLLIDK
ncbi:unnamed protein product [Meloidogyne enterolobii]|uniref:Uncharacterized protein n=1 Tax=Meloidogyne enterolobii TaxID=390850 RepID=A0ACB0YRA9_MELEN